VPFLLKHQPFLLKHQPFLLKHQPFMVNKQGIFGYRIGIQRIPGLVTEVRGSW
jgi:hypothetical protein